MRPNRRPLGDVPPFGGAQGAPGFSRSVNTWRVLRALRIMSKLKRKRRTLEGRGGGTAPPPFYGLWDAYEEARRQDCMREFCAFRMSMRHSDRRSKRA